MTDFRDLKIGDGHEDSWSLWDGVRDYIEDEDFVSSVDAELERCESEEEAGKIFEHVIEYMDAMAPEGYAFGVNECNEVGFWPEDEIYEEDDEDESIESITEGALEAGEEEEDEERILNDVPEHMKITRMCQYCKKIMEKGDPKRVSHGICPECYEEWEKDPEGFEKRFFKGEKFRKNPQGTVSFWFSKDRFQTPEKAKSWLRKYGSYRTGHYSTDGFWSFPQMPESRVRRYKGKIRSKYISDGVMVKFVPSRLL